MKERVELYRNLLRRGYDCPSPINYPKRFDLYVKIHKLHYEEVQTGSMNNKSFFVASLVCLTMIFWLIAL